MEAPSVCGGRLRGDRQAGVGLRRAITGRWHPDITPIARRAAPTPVSPSGPFDRHHGAELAGKLPGEVQGQVRALGPHRDVAAVGEELTAPRRASGH